MKSNWMQKLFRHYEWTRRRLPDRQLLLLSDIDGTILDTRHQVLAALRVYDRTHETHHFERLQLADVTAHECRLEDLLEMLRLPAKTRRGIAQWYVEQDWKLEAAGDMHRPFQGVLEVIRWFQLQPNTWAGLVTGRLETLREETLRCLNALGRPYRVEFSSELLYMNPGQWVGDVPDAKVAGLKHFEAAGHHVFAFIDDEASSLQMVAEAAGNEDLLLLHADSTCESQRMRPPRGAACGKEYRIDELVPGEEALPSCVQLVWHGINDRQNMREFLSSGLKWAEMDVRLEPARSGPVLRHDSTQETPLAKGEKWLSLEDALDQIQAAGRAIKLDLKGGDQLLDRVLELLGQRELKDANLWFNGYIDRLGAEGFRRIAKTHPGAIIQCPGDFMAPLILAAPKKARELLLMFEEWGINRFSFSWTPTNLEEVDLVRAFDRLETWGHEFNIYNVPDLPSFLRAVLLLPSSVTADFNFPKWNFYGTGKYGAIRPLTSRPRRRSRRA